MPITSAGFFALALLAGTKVTVLGYLGTALVYAAASDSRMPVASRAGFPEPASVRTLPRDQDGAVLASSRRRGELSEAVTSNESFYVVTEPFSLAQPDGAAGWNTITVRGA